MQRLHARWNTTSLRARLVGILILLLLAALTATGYGVQRVLSSYLVSQIDDQLISTARNASNENGLLNALIDPNARRRFPSPFVVQVSIDGQSPLAPVAGLLRRSDDPLPRFPTVSSAQALSLTGTAYAVRASDGSRWRATTFAATASTLGDEAGTGAAVTILQSMSGVENAVERLRLLILLIGAAVLATSGLLGWLAIRRAFVPLREVEGTAAAIAAGDLSQRIPALPTTTEVGRLTSSLNGMLTQIEGAFRAQEASETRTRRFAADASHELRTPLASIRGYAELYRQGAVPPEEVPRTLRRIEDEAKRMGGLVEDLLLLARLDEQRPTRSEPVDLAVLAGDAVHDARGLDPERAVRLVALGDANGAAPPRGPSPAPTVGDEDRLRQVVANLLANAVRHTPASTPIEVAVGVEPVNGTVRATLEVRDHGPGLDPELAAKVFERFYRADPSRRRGHGGGSGLGLSIVDAVVAAHGGEVSVRETAGGGATFVVRLPTAAPADQVAEAI